MSPKVPFNPLNSETLRNALTSKRMHMLMYEQSIVSQRTNNFLDEPRIFQKEKSITASSLLERSSVEKDLGILVDNSETTVYYETTVYSCG